jgi:hypothetical protein
LSVCLDTTAGRNETPCEDAVVAERTLSRARAGNEHHAQAPSRSRPGRRCVWSSSARAASFASTSLARASRPFPTTRIGASGSRRGQKRGPRRRRRPLVVQSERLWGIALGASLRMSATRKSPAVASGSSHG